MRTGFLLRFLATVVLLLILGAPTSISATSLDLPLLRSELDLSDKDGDGLPAYLDPDDNDDGTTDEDTPAPPKSEDPEVENPEDESNDSGSGEGVVNPPVPPVASVIDSQPVPQAASNSAQVTSLPNTGVGPSGHYLELMTFFVLLSGLTLFPRLMQRVATVRL